MMAAKINGFVFSASTTALDKRTIRTTIPTSANDVMCVAQTAALALMQRIRISAGNFISFSM